MPYLSLIGRGDADDDGGAVTDDFTSELFC
jgi:hypothetical protein